MIRPPSEQRPRLVWSADSRPSTEADITEEDVEYQERLDEERKQS
ncbi:hypothetical protein [Marmoricola sp. URHB0036]|nr:hypothetical protein [Marmoricola sp. URHB0036]